LIRGRLTGHLPPGGPLTATLLSRAMGVLDEAEVAALSPQPEVSNRDLAREHPYAALFTALSTLARADGCFIAADIGSASRLCYPPYEAATVALCLGSAISVAAGASRVRPSSIAVIGDMGLLHSGLGGLVEIVHRQLPVVTVVLANGTSAQTGGQLHHA